jgi:hypothetical protein
MKYVSFSLWGTNPIYNVGAIRNVELCKEIYKEWKIVVYYNNSVPNETISKLKEFDVELHKMNSLIYPSFWRFLISDKDDCEYSIFRDCDSRISLREKLAVDEWISSDKTIHIMRDHPYHKIPAGNNSIGILAGMWGIKGNVLPMTQMITDFIKTNNNDYYGIDQNFLKIIYSQYKNDSCIHDEFFENKPFPIKRNDGRFVGERIDINEQPLTDDYKILL